MEQQQQRGEWRLQLQQGQEQQQGQQRQGHHRFHRNLLTIKKIIFYDFMPSKMEEDYCRRNNTHYQGKTYLLEMRDMYPRPRYHPKNPWRIRKILKPIEVTMKMIILTEQEAFDHVFRYWSYEMTLHALRGTDLFRELVIWDVTELDKAVKVRSVNIFFQKGPTQGCYSLGLGHLVESRRLRPLDDIGMYWEPRASAFIFGLLCRYLGDPEPLLTSGLRI